jgi:hypothetical protein
MFLLINGTFYTINGNFSTVIDNIVLVALRAKKISALNIKKQIKKR